MSRLTGRMGGGVLLQQANPESLTSSYQHLGQTPDWTHARSSLAPSDLYHRIGIYHTNPWGEREYPPAPVRFFPPVRVYYGGRYPYGSQYTTGSVQRDGIQYHKYWAGPWYNHH